MITKTDAVVLKSMNFRDSSKIVTFYTRRYGKVKGIAKGARQMKSKFGAALEPITKVSLVFYRKEHRDLQLVSECSSVKTYRNIHSELERMAVALSVLELVNQLTHEEEENETLFLLLIGILNELERARGNFLSLLYAFEIRYAAQFGFMPNLDSCSVCGRQLDELGAEGSAFFRLAQGAIVCARCGIPSARLRFEKMQIDRRGTRNPPASDARDGNIRISIGALKALHRLLTARLESISSLELSAAAGNEIDGTLRLYLRQHFEDFKPLKSLEILRKLNISKP